MVAIQDMKLINLEPAYENKALNTAFREIRNYLAGKAIGITRDQSLMHEVVSACFVRLMF